METCAVLGAMRGKAAAISGELTSVATSQGKKRRRKRLNSNVMLLCPESKPLSTYLPGYLCKAVGRGLRDLGVMVVPYSALTFVSGVYPASANPRTLPLPIDPYKAVFLQGHSYAKQLESSLGPNAEPESLEVHSSSIYDAYSSRYDAHRHALCSKRPPREYCTGFILLTWC